MSRVKRSKKHFKWITLVAALTLLSAIGLIKSKDTVAEAAGKETVKLRIIGTTDIHGQLNSTDYELGVDYSIGGLARVYDLIQQTRSELPKENTITLDTGDVLYDYTTEYIYSENQNEIQPIYKAMALIGYDAITLGNHEFDYGYDYLLRQLDGSGLRAITVVSNVTDSKTGEYPFLENMLIIRKLKTSSGKEVTVKVGIIGQTIPTLTSKTHSYAGILKTEDMVDNAKTQAKKLKEMGADIIVALSHTGIGPEKPELNFKNVAYALTKIPEIDVVVCGHEHNLFPTTDMSSPYYKLPNVDKKTYLMNGKNVIMAGDRGRAIGVVDLTLEVNNKEISIAERSSELRMVNVSNTKENATIANMFGSWASQLLEYSTETIATLEEGKVIQNFYGLLGDNYAIQLLNDAKMDYALRYINTVGKSYQSYPVIAASTYASYGEASIDDFINISDKITESRLTSIQPYNNYLYLYTITGKQLKEWLEWSASAYETTIGSTSWKDATMASYMKATGLKSLIREEWLDNWSTFYVFDGIDYVIDPSIEPRYDINGNKVSNKRRVISVKRNGVEVTDDMVFVLATNKITKPTQANSGVEKNSILGGFNRTQAVLSKYISQISDNGTVLPHLDYNWRVNLPLGNQFIVKAPNYAKSFVEATSWFKKYLGESNHYGYFVASYPAASEDNVGPHIVVTPTKTTATGTLYSAAVQVSDASKIKYLKYMVGKYDLDYPSWSAAQDLKSDNTFLVTKNGTYSVYAEDIHGNKSVYHLVVNNFNDNLLGDPVVDSYTNRKTKISGRAEPGATIVFEAYTGTYEGKVEGNGKFSCALPAQPSGTTVNVYVKDESKGKISGTVTVTVKRTGPNQPIVNPILNTSGYLSGQTNDTDADVIAIIDDVVYVSDKGGKELFEKNTEIYQPSLEIVETKVEIDDLGYFIMELPPQVAGTSIKVYNIDHLSRSSRVNTVEVLEAAPNAPVVYEISNIERVLNGYVPTDTKTVYDIEISTKGKTYKTKTDKSGKFSFEFAEQLRENQSILVTASDVKNGAGRTSYQVEVLVKNIENYVKKNSTILTLDKVTDKSLLISGSYTESSSLYLAITKGKGKTFESELVEVKTDDTGVFDYELTDKLEAGMNIYAMVRFTDGNILLAQKTSVLPGRPDIPVLVQEITNTDKKVQIRAKKDSEVTLTIGSKTYTSKVYKEDSKTGDGIYTFEIDREVSGTQVIVKASNESGVSDVLTSQIIKVAPDQPTVKQVKAGSKTIKGTIELLDYQAPGQEGTETKEEIPKEFKDAAPKVAKTQTRVFAQIGSKTYEGTIDDKGNFTIKIPAQKAGTQISVWGTNKAGRGPLIKVAVVK